MERGRGRETQTRLTYTGPTPPSGPHALGAHIPASPAASPRFWLLLPAEERCSSERSVDATNPPRQTCGLEQEPLIPRRQNTIRYLIGRRAQMTPPRSGHDHIACWCCSFGGLGEKGKQKQTFFHMQPSCNAFPRISQRLSRAWAWIDQPQPHTDPY